jgi:hypothetical protein
MLSRFQAWLFLAHYEAMCPCIEPEKPESNTLPELDSPASQQSNSLPSPQSTSTALEIGGREGPDPTRFGDWEKAGRCIDF